MLEIFAFDARTGERLGDLEVAGLSWSEHLNGHMTMSGRVDLAAKPQAERVRQFIDPASGDLTRLVKLVLRDPPAHRAFLLWEPHFVDRRFLELQCAGVWSWFSRRPIDQTRRFRQVDQHAIAAALIDGFGDGVGLTTSFELSGVRRDRTFEGFERAPVAQRVEELADVSGGFEFAVESQWTGSNTVEVWRPSTPRAGRPWPESGIQIDADSEGVDVRLTSRAPVTHWTAIGEGEGNDMLIATATADLPAFPRLDESSSYKSVSRQPTLNNHATGDLNRHNRRRSVWSATVLDEFAKFDGLVVGDECQVSIGKGDYLFPEGLEMVRRVIGQTVTLSDDGGPHTVALELEAT